MSWFSRRKPSPDPQTGELFEWTVDDAALSGQRCIACGEPLFGPEMLHASSVERPSDLNGALRWAEAQGVTP